MFLLEMACGSIEARSFQANALAEIASPHRSQPNK